MGVQRHAAALLAATFLALNGPLAAASAAEPIKNSACLECHGGQDAHQDQRRRQRGLPVRRCGQARRLRPQDQHLRELPRGHHRQAPRRQRPGAAGQLQAVPRDAIRELRRQRPRPGPGQGAKGFRDVQRLSRRAHHPAAHVAGFAAAFLPAGRDVRRGVTTRWPRTWKKACTARPWPPATARRPPAPIAIRSIRSRRSRAARR